MERLRNPQLSLEEIGEAYFDEFVELADKSHVPYQFKSVSDEIFNKIREEPTGFYAKNPSVFTRYQELVYRLLEKSNYSPNEAIYAIAYADTMSLVKIWTQK